jgi:hypothetical protein
MPSVAAAALRSESCSRKCALTMGGFSGSRPPRWIELAVVGRMCQASSKTPECLASFRSGLASKQIPRPFPSLLGKGVELLGLAGVSLEPELHAHEGLLDDDALPDVGAFDPHVDARPA